jgi:hypothetical protein
MPLPSSGTLTMAQINAEFGRGLNLNAYRGTTYYTASAGPFTFPSGAISFSNFYGTQLANPNVTDFTISPAVGGVTNWSLNTNGPLNLASTGQWTIVAQRNVTIAMKMWGAGGGPGGDYAGGPNGTGRIGSGGGGGYASGNFQLIAGNTYILQVGQGGSRVTNGPNSNRTTYLASGVTPGNWGSQGGGYTGFFISGVSQGNAILMAGGGGGGSDTLSYPSGAAGGGSSGQGTLGGGQSGGAGTQSAGGSGSFNGADTGQPLAGGYTVQNAKNGGLGAGGGGYWGGGGGNIGGGGGGSGRIGSGVSSGVLTTGNFSTPGNSGDGQRGSSGNGAANTSRFNVGSDGRSIFTFVSAP